MNADIKYGIRLSILYACIWFVDLLDSTLLNIALPEISHFFHIDPTNAEWALIGFLLAMSIGMVISNPLGNFLGTRTTYLGAQWIYVVSSLACGFSMNFSQLVIFRIFQGLGGGLAIPIGLSMIMTAMPHDKWAKTGAWMNLFTLLAPALGPILGGYITSNLSWRWLFFIKLPISFVCVLLSHFWVRKMARKKEGKFDWLGFYFAAFSLSLILLVFSEAGKNVFTNQMLIFLFCLSLVLFGGFIWQERRASNPLVPLKIFKNPLFAWGNVIQSAANMIFLGATFITALYLQWGLGFDIIKTGWIMAAITIGMMAAMPLTGKFYNQIGPLPFIIPGLILMAFAMFALIFVTPSTSPWLIALLILCEGFGSAALQATNFVSIFTEIPHELKGAGSALYALFKQISASLGVALSTMALSFSMVVKNITNLEKGAPSSLFYPSFILLGIIPLLALPLCLLIDNRRALKKMQKMDHLETEFEEATE